MTRTCVGIDTSLTSTGLAAAGARVGLHRMRSSGKADATLAQRVGRADRLAGEIVLTTLRYKPDLVVIEAPSYGSVNGRPHDRSGLWWLVVFALVQGHGLHVMEVPPTNRIKYATGKGSGPLADKDVVLANVIRRYTDYDVTGNDQADAVLLAAIGKRLLGEPIEANLPALNLTALDKLSLPKGLVP